MKPQVIFDLKAIITRTLPEMDLKKRIINNFFKHDLLNIFLNLDCIMEHFCTMKIESIITT